MTDDCDPDVSGQGMTPHERAHAAWAQWCQNVQADADGESEYQGFAHEVAGYLDPDAAHLIAPFAAAIRAAVDAERAACADLLRSALAQGEDSLCALLDALTP